MLKPIVPFFFFFLTTTLTFAQWTGTEPVLSQKQCLYDLRMAPNNDQVAWGLCTKYSVGVNSFTQDFADTMMIARTSDGGVTWTGVKSPGQPGLFASNICAISESTAWISHIAFAGFIRNSIWKTTDGGISWVEQLTYGFPDISGYVNGVYFWDAQTGIAWGDPTSTAAGGTSFFEIWRTTDGGQNWARIPDTAIPAALANEVGFSGNATYDVIGNTIWFYTVDNTNFPALAPGKRIFKSTDQGLTWQASTFTDLYNMSFSDQQNGIALKGSPWIGENQSSVPVYRTTDGGATWQQSGAFGNVRTTSAELVPGTNSIIATVRTNNISGYKTLLSHNYGQTWTEIGASDEFVANLTFASPSIGYGGDWARTSTKPFKMYRYSGNPISGLIAQKPLDIELRIFPNPATDFVQIDVQLPTSQNFRLLLHDAKGQLIAEQSGDTNGLVSFDLSVQPAGVYTVILSTTEGFVSKVILK
jgi:photosystem II stability/assembly factor-like uncharacterized protein